MVKKKKNRRGIDRRILIFVSIAPVGCLLALLFGLVLAWYLFPTRFVNARVSDLSPQHADEVVIMAAADFAKNKDIKRADEILGQLNVPNKPQFVSLVAERMIRTNRGPVDDDIKEVVQLADALGVSTVSMVAYVSTPTPTFTPVPPTPTATSTIPPTPTDTPTPPVPTPTATPVATDTPVPVVNTPVRNTPTPAPPTDTPTPAATATPSVDFVITKQRLLTKQENGGCAGNHNIFVDVIDAKGNPIKGVQLGDAWNNPGPVTGHKGDNLPGHAEYDLYKNGGFMILVKSDPTAGRPVTSQTSELLSSDDWKIGIPRLIEAGYCPDEATCKVLWNSGVFGVGNNSICWGHYSWEVVFQRTW